MRSPATRRIPFVLLALAAGAPALLGNPALARAAGDPADPNLRAAAILMKEAQREADASRYEAARKLYARACVLAPTPRCLRSLATTELLSGRPVDALHHFRAELAHPSLTTDVKPDKLELDRAAVKEAYAKSGHLEVHAPDGAALALDGLQLTEPLPADRVLDVMPGPHRLEARVGDDIVHAEATATAGALVAVQLHFQPAAPPPAPPQARTDVALAPVAPASSNADAEASSSWWTTPHTAGAIAAGAGVVSLVLGGVFAAESRSQSQTADQERPCVGACPALQSTLSAQHTDYLLSWTFVGIGAAAAAAGAALILWPTHRSLALAPSSNAAGLQLMGDF